MSLSVGDRYIDFTLPNSDKQLVQLSSVVGSEIIVLAFFPGAFTGACDREVCALRDGMGRFGELGAAVYGISVDSPFVLKEFSNKYSLNFTLLSDFTRNVINQYGVLFHNLGGVQGYDVANRVVFIIDKEGVIRYTWAASPSPGVEPNYDELIAQVAALKA